jgi:hypothetical protein
MARETLAPRLPLSLTDGREVELALPGGGEMGERIRALDWTATALGPVSHWPQSLRTSLSICLGANVPISLFWGPELLMLYNDAYRELLGERHPSALAARGRDVWPDAGLILERVLSGGTATALPPEPQPSARPTPTPACGVSLSYSPIRDESGGIAGVYCTASATTPQPASEQTSAGAVGAADPLAVRFNESFLGVLAHDLRNPLSAIATAAQLLQLRADTPRIATPVVRILASADRLERMIVQLLDVARLHWGGGLGLERTSVDLAELARGVAAELGADPSCPICVSTQGDVRGHWDRERLYQLLTTLTLNAARHGTAGESIALSVDGSAADVVALEVQNGGAMSAELQAVVFDPLPAADRSIRHEGASGLGLGLYLTRQIVLAHGGSILLDSDPENGTRVRVTLPRALPTGAG